MFTCELVFMPHKGTLTWSHLSDSDVSACSRYCAVPRGTSAYLFSSSWALACSPVKAEGKWGTKYSELLCHLNPTLLWSICHATLLKDFSNIQSSSCKKPCVCTWGYLEEKPPHISPRKEDSKSKPRTLFIPEVNYSRLIMVKWWITATLKALINPTSSLTAYKKEADSVAVWQWK